MDRLIDFRQSGIVELAAHEPNEALAAFGIELFEKIAEFRFVKRLDRGFDVCGTLGVDRVTHVIQKIGGDEAVLVVDSLPDGGLGRIARVKGVSHAPSRSIDERGR